jgi:NTE family protein
MARALVEAGHHPDALYGSSAGALNAVWLAADPSLDGIERLQERWAHVRTRQVLPMRPWDVVRGLAGRRDHLVSPAPLARWLRAVSPLRRLEDGALPVTVVATDVADGSEVLLSQGPAVPALMASSAIPGVFPPVFLDGRWLIDGSVAMDTALGPAVEDGAATVFVLQSVPDPRSGRPRSALDVMLRSSAILVARHHRANVEEWGRRCRLFVVPAPVVPGTSPFDFSHGAQLADAGYRLAREWLQGAKPVNAVPDGLCSGRLEDGQGVVAP